MADQLILGQRACVVPVLLLGRIRVGALHQEDSYCQAHLSVPNGGDISMPIPQLLDVDVEEPIADESEQRLHGCVLLQPGPHLALGY